jgi:hypothetical protein
MDCDMQMKRIGDVRGSSSQIVTSQAGDYCIAPNSPIVVRILSSNGGKERIWGRCFPHSREPID